MFFSKRIFYFMKMVEFKDYSKAADALCLTPSAIRHSICELEDEIKLKLFMKQSRQLYLTSAGMAFYADILPFYTKICKVFSFYQVGCVGALPIRVVIDGFYYPDISDKISNIAGEKVISYLSNGASYYNLKNNNCDIAICTFPGEDFPVCDEICRVALSIESVGVIGTETVFSKYNTLLSAMKNETIMVRSSVLDQPIMNAFRRECSNFFDGFSFKGYPDFADVLSSVYDNKGLALLTEGMERYIPSVMNVIYKNTPFNLKVNRGIYFKKVDYEKLIDIVSLIKN